MKLSRLTRPCFAAAAVLVAAAVFSACNKSSAPPSEPQDPQQQALIKHGRAIYQTTCIACHNSNPKQPGALGPDVWGSSLPLITARVISASYPPGYKPKRQTHTMVALPQFKDDLPALHAYLNSPQ